MLFGQSSLCHLAEVHYAIWLTFTILDGDFQVTDYSSATAAFAGLCLFGEDAVAAVEDEDETV